MNLHSLPFIKALNVSHIEAVCSKHAKGRSMRIVANQGDEEITSMNIITSERCDQYHAFVAGAEAALAVMNEILSKKVADREVQTTSQNCTSFTLAETSSTKGGGETLTVTLNKSGQEGAGTPSTDCSDSG